MVNVYMPILYDSFTSYVEERGERERERGWRDRQTDTETERETERDK